MLHSMLRAVARSAFRSSNRFLAYLGLRLERNELDFDALPIDRATRQALFTALATEYDRWVSSQNLFEPLAEFDTVAEIEAFFERWLGTPFRRQSGGSRFNNLLWLFLIAKSYRPSVVIDSGTYEGASAWALSSGAPHARVRSFDIDLSQLKLRCSQVHYVEADWTNCQPDWVRGDRVLAYFDDHVNQARRLIEAAERDCTLIIFDDDYPITSFFHMAPSADVLPKIEFALSDQLEEGQVMTWRAGGRVHQWAVEKDLLDRARSHIHVTDRLPFTGLTTGIMQTPYRLVVPR